jgi:hypothetical protein
MEDNVRVFFDLVARMMARRWLQDSTSFTEKEPLRSKAESMEAVGSKLVRSIPLGSVMPDSPDARGGRIETISARAR